MKIVVLLALVFLVFGCVQTESEYVSGEVIVVMKETATQEELNEFIAKYNIQWEEIGFDRIYVISVPDGQEHLWLNIFKIDPLVSSAELNSIVSATHNNG